MQVALNSANSLFGLLERRYKFKFVCIFSGLPLGMVSHLASTPTTNSKHNAKIGVMFAILPGEWTKCNMMHECVVKSALITGQGLWGFSR